MKNKSATKILRKKKDFQFVALIEKIMLQTGMTTQLLHLQAIRKIMSRFIRQDVVSKGEKVSQPHLLCSYNKGVGMLISWKDFTSFIVQVYKVKNGIGLFLSM